MTDPAAATDIDRFIAVHNHGHVHLEDSMGTDLHIVNNARVSFDQESTEFTDKERGLLNFLMRERHGSPWESVVFRFDVKAPIFVVREWQRHRVGCLTGDTEVSFVDTNGTASRAQRKTMDELHRMWTEGETNGIATPQETGGKWRVRKMKLRVLDEGTNEFTTGHICDVIDSGQKQVFRVDTAGGRSIQMTADHRILTDHGWKRLGEVARINGTECELPEDAFIMANGVACHQDHAWLAERRARGMSVEEIAQDAGVSYHTIRKWLKVHDLQFAKEERSFAKGSVPCNFWRGGSSSERALIGTWTRERAAAVHARFDYTCQSCKTRGGKLHAHHVLPVWFAPDKARDFDNLVSICAPCHREIHRSTVTELQFAHVLSGIALPELAAIPASRGRRLVAHADRIVAVTYVGVRQTYDLSVEGPWHNFVANGLVVHNSFNEQSARYSQVPDHYYVPEDGYVREQVGKPGAYSFETIEDAAVRGSTIELLDSTQRAAFDAYHAMLDQGVAKELARTVLPVGMFSRMKWTVNLRALFNFLSLRNDQHAQREIRDYAIAVEQLAKDVVPVAFNVFEQNGRVCP